VKKRASGCHYLREEYPLPRFSFEEKGWHYETKDALTNPGL